MVIRQESPEDYKNVYELVTEAFLEAEHTDGDEQNLVERLRESSSFVPQLSLVAVEHGHIIGYIMFTEVKVGDTVQLALAPLAVSPAYQGKGVGGALIMKGHEIAAKMRYGYSILLGHPSYYPKFGYVPASTYGISSPIDVPEECFMAVQLYEGSKRPEGMLEYPKEFGI